MDSVNRERSVALLGANYIDKALVVAFGRLTQTQVEQSRPGLAFVDGIPVAHVNGTLRLREATSKGGGRVIEDVIYERLGVMLVASNDHSSLQVFRADEIDPTTGLSVAVFQFERGKFGENGEVVEANPVFEGKMIRLPKRYSQETPEARAYSITLGTIESAYRRIDGNKSRLFFTE